MEAPSLLKDKAPPRAPLSLWWLLGALAACTAALGAAALADYCLPEPLRSEHPDKESFIAEIAHQHLVNLTDIGPRVAGSYENEVLAVSVLSAAVRQIAAQAAPHNIVQLDLHAASGAFHLTFLDGMNNVYRGVQSLAVLVAARGSEALTERARRNALLLNCHFDTVPDSPGASDDGAGCAVLLETLRALAASRRPLRRPALFLLNGAEENIMQASHAFVTTHRWARLARAFINVEACGAGGREVLFQAGPRAPWLLRAYAAAAPRPFASSLAQELFRSGAVPGDTDFRVFRDFGALSGLDLAWSANGYVYHTRLDTAAGVPPAALQRTGDNVLALTRALLSDEAMDSAELPAESEQQPVFFDVLGLCVVTASAPVAAALAAAALLLLPLRVALSAAAARRQLYVRRAWWWRVVCRAAVAALLSLLAGALCAAGAGAMLHVLRARLAFYSRGWLLAPLHALPALAGAAAAARRLRRDWSPLLRGWWAARAAADAVALLWGAALLLCAVRRLRSGFLPLLWVLLPGCAELAAHATGAQDGTRALWWAGGALLPMLQTWYLALGSLHMFVPVMGRAGTPPLPPDVMMALLVALLVLSACSWLLPLLLVARHPARLIYAALGVSLATCCLVALTPLGAAYCDARPQRLMVFHTRRTVHPPPGAAGQPAHEDLYWVPELDPNTSHTVDKYVPELRDAVVTKEEDCTRWVYCGAPYYLPVLRLVARGYTARAPAPPLAQLQLSTHLSELNDTTQLLRLNITGPSHVVVIVSPVAGARVAWSSALADPLEGPSWGARRTYFFALHDALPGAARAAKRWTLDLHLQHALSSPPPSWAALSVAGHALSGPAKLQARHADLLHNAPSWIAATGWGVHLHLLTV